MKQTDALKILKSGRNVYLTGAAGSGKTHVLNEYISYLRDRGVGTAITASTGIASTHIGGTTIHSWSGLGIRDELTEYELDKLEATEYLYKRYSNTSVLIIDEVSMISVAMFNTIEQLCRKMKRTDVPFGGMQIVLSGDFFQLPPIVKGNNNPEFIASSRAWQNVDIRVCYLTEQFRSTDMLLNTLLNEIRKANVTDESRELLKIAHERQVDTTITPTRLFTHNIDVDALNDRELKKLPGETYKYEMSHTGRKSLVENLKKGVLAPENLRLKKDALVMFVKNSFSEGYVNGTLGKIESFEHNVPIVRTLAGDKIYVSKAEWTIEFEPGKTATVSQLPLRLAWAITIHKSQGLSLDSAIIDLSKTFVAGQGYVALSRLRSLNGLYLEGINEMALSLHANARELDTFLLQESSKWESVIKRFSADEMNKMHHDFIVRAGGSNDINVIDINKKKNKDVGKVKIASFEATRTLIEAGVTTIKELAQARGLKYSTIMNHLESIKETYPKFNLQSFAPDQKDLEIILLAFSASKSTKLTPVKKRLKDKYDFDTIRLARLFFE